MTAQALIQFEAIALHPAPNCRVARLHAALSEQLFDIAEWEPVVKIPKHGAQNQLGPFTAT